ncbi:WD40/YVTN/BNR-like repeat-containing protein [Pseudomonas aeruginosa]|uniref:WD40/YVTN/BNR-like repeat-containing protein n=1 Tax=Pseudomonas aeruginosa TaxID=287 RepID=UPI00079FD710|nr:YCF48-related protein [Pseudomonas aeruginosa]KYO84087.1 Ycf48-like protein [Pseudomonas aeruginosa]
MMSFLLRATWGRGAVLALAFASSILSVSSWADSVLEQSAAEIIGLHPTVQLAVANAGTRLVSVGERGIVLLSDDQGKSWRQGQVPVSTTLTRVVFVDSNNGWAVGHSGVVIHTADGGENWVKQLDGLVAAQIELQAARSASNDSSSSQRRLREAERLLADGADKPFLTVLFKDARNGMVFGAYGLAFATSNGGQTWRSLMGNLQAADGFHLYSAVAIGEKLYLAGEQGLLLQSDDGAQSFSRLESPSNATLFGISASPSTMLAYGLKGRLYRSDDGGAHWAHVAMPEATITAAIHIENDTFLLANEVGQIFRSEDDGRTFHPLPMERLVPVTSLALATDGVIVKSGLRGVSRITEMQRREELAQ